MLIDLIASVSVHKARAHLQSRSSTMENTLRVAGCIDEDHKVLVPLHASQECRSAAQSMRNAQTRLICAHKCMKAASIIFFVKAGFSLLESLSSWAFKVPKARVLTSDLSQKMSWVLCSSAVIAGGVGKCSQNQILANYKQYQAFFEAEQGNV